jgi:hypothetical protein
VFVSCFLLMFWSSVGTLQVIASWADLEGISFFFHRVAGYIFGVGITIAIIIWFFAADKHTRPYVSPQLGEQFGAYVAGVLVALVFTLVVSSLIKFRKLRPIQGSVDKPQGVESLKRMTWFQAVRHSLRRASEER